MSRFHFYGGAPCPLCDEAMDMIASIRPDVLMSLEKYDVKVDHDLYHLYGARIPVLKDCERGRELAWPFDHTALKEFLA